MSKEYTLLRMKGQPLAEPQQAECCREPIVVYLSTPCIRRPQVTTAPARIGFLLDDFTTAAGLRDRIAEYIMQQDDAWWTERALQQIALTSRRLSHLQDVQPGMHQLMLPLERAAYSITFMTKAARITQHDRAFVGRYYTATTYIVTSPGSASMSSVILRNVNGMLTLSFEVSSGAFLRSVSLPVGTPSSADHILRSVVCAAPALLAPLYTHAPRSPFSRVGADGSVPCWTAVAVGVL